MGLHTGQPGALPGSVGSPALAARSATAAIHHRRPSPGLLSGRNACAVQCGRARACCKSTTHCLSPPSPPRPSAVVRVRPAFAGEGRYFVRVPDGTNVDRAGLEGMDAIGEAGLPPLEADEDEEEGEGENEGEARRLCAASWAPDCWRSMHCSRQLRVTLARRVPKRPVPARPNRSTWLRRSAGPLDSPPSCPAGAACPGIKLCSALFPFQTPRMTRSTGCWWRRRTSSTPRPW